MPNRTCSLCKDKMPMKEMIKLGKDFVCPDREMCRRRRLDSDGSKKESQS
jgi:hypothetical protein